MVKVVDARLAEAAGRMRGNDGTDMRGSYFGMGQLGGSAWGGASEEPKSRRANLERAWRKIFFFFQVEEGAFASD